MKKILSLFFLTLMPLFAMADAQGTCGDNLTWEYVESTRTLTISGTGAMTNYEYEGGVSPWKDYSNEILTVQVDEGVTSIGNYAFGYCDALSSITLPSTLTSIGDDAFYMCIDLTSITLPSKLTGIGDEAFNMCYSLTSVTVKVGTPFVISDDVFNAETYAGTLTVPSGTMAAYKATDGWKNFGDNITGVIGTVELNSEGYATFSYAYDVEVSGAEVYTAVFDGNIKCTKVEDQIVPAYNGVILKGEPNAEVTLKLTNAGKKELTGNSLKPTTTAEGLAEKETALVLSGKAFENYTGETFVADKAYMPYSGTTGDAIEIVFDGATYIESVGAENNILDRAVIKTIENGKLVIKTANGKYSTAGAKIK